MPCHFNRSISNSDNDVISKIASLEMIPHSARLRQQTLSSVRNPVDSSSWARIYGLNLSSRSQEPSMKSQSTQLHSTGSTFLSSTSNGQSPPAGRPPQPRSANPERVLSRSSVLLMVASFGMAFRLQCPWRQQLRRRHRAKSIQ